MNQEEEVNKGNKSQGKMKRSGRFPTPTPHYTTKI